VYITKLIKLQHLIRI